MATTRLVWGGALIAFAALAAIPAVLAGTERADVRSGSASFRIAPRGTLDGAEQAARTLLADQQYAAAAEAARAILRRAPLDQTALRILAVADQRLGESDEADMATTVAALLSWRDPIIQMRMFRQVIAAGDLAAAARRADALARISDFETEGFARMTALLPEREGPEAVAARLAARPPWRGAYLAGLTPTEPETTASILALTKSLAATPAPLDRAETAQLLWKFVRQGHGIAAYGFWRERHPIGSGNLIDDPDFARLPIAGALDVAAPFDWTAEETAMVRFVATRDAAGKPALVIEPGGGRSAMFVSRYVVAPAGRYRLSYTVSGNPDTLEQLHPDVRCARGAVKIEPESAVRSSEITRMVVAVDVPYACGLLRIGFSFDASDTVSPSAATIRGVTFKPA